MSKLVHGVGINDTNTPTTENGKITKLYDLWQSMLRRSYSDKCHEKHPTYIECSVSDNFKSRAYFECWSKQQRGFALGWQLDKDLLFKGNKIYSEDVCVFVPKEINLALIKRDASRGQWCIGVYFNKKKGKFCARLAKHSKLHNLGYFSTENEAFLAYKTAKESYLKELAEIYAPNLDQRAYNALMSYEVSIAD